MVRAKYSLPDRRRADLFSPRAGVISQACIDESEVMHRGGHTVVPRTKPRLSDLERALEQPPGLHIVALSELRQGHVVDIRPRVEVRASECELGDSQGLAHQVQRRRHIAE